MKTGGFLVGAAAGLLFALLFVGGASALGPSATHIDLVHGGSALTSTTGLSTPVVGGNGGVQPSTGSTPSPPSTPSAHPLSALSSLSTDGGGGLALLLVPILLAALAGAVLYVVSVRRVEAE